jgi:GTP cyclohydrolase I
MYKPTKIIDLEETARELLVSTTGLDPNSEHGKKTPRRFVDMLMELTTPKEFEFTTFDNTDHVDEMVVVAGIPFYTLCEHHVIPFFGQAHVAYVPNASIAGLSKFSRAVQYFAKGLWTQEGLTIAIADFLEDRLEPMGLGVVMKAEHLCMSMRGVQTPGALTTTAAMRGVFADHGRTAKAEFLEAIR